MKETSSITGWHAHVYFDGSEKEAARQLCEGAAARFGIPMGRMHDDPIGPHPKGSCQLSIPPALFGEVVPWLVLNHGALSVLIHADTGDHLADHTDHLLWLGTPVALDLSIFA